MEARFTEPSVLILASLSSGPKHGYVLIKDVKEIASVTLGPGTLYGQPATDQDRRFCP